MGLDKIKRTLTPFGGSCIIWGAIMLILDSINVSIVVKYNLLSAHTRTASGIWGGFNFMVSGIVIITTFHGLRKFSQYRWLLFNTTFAVLEGIAVLVLQILAAADCAPNADGVFNRCNQSVYQLHRATAVFAGMSLGLELIVTVVAIISYSKFKEALKN